MRSSQFSLQSLFAVTALVAAFVSFAIPFGFFTVRPSLYGLFGASNILAIASAGAFKKSNRWWTIALAVSGISTLVNCFVIEHLTGNWGWGFTHSAGSEHWWLSQLSFGFGLFAIVNRISAFARNKRPDLMFKRMMICFMVLILAVALSAMSKSVGMQLTSMHHQTSYHLHFAKVFVGCLAYSIVIAVAWEWVPSPAKPT